MDLGGERAAARHHWQEALDIYTQAGDSRAKALRVRLASPITPLEVRQHAQSTLS